MKSKIVSKKYSIKEDVKVSPFKGKRTLKLKAEKGEKEINEPFNAVVLLYTSGKQKSSCYDKIQWVKIQLNLSNGS